MDTKPTPDAIASDDTAFRIFLRSHIEKCNKSPSAAGYNVGHEEKALVSAAYAFAVTGIPEGRPKHPTERKARIQAKLCSHLGVEQLRDAMKGNNLMPHKTHISILADLEDLLTKWQRDISVLDSPSKVTKCISTTSEGLLCGIQSLLREARDMRFDKNKPNWRLAFAKISKYYGDYRRIFHEQVHGDEEVVRRVMSQRFEVVSEVYFGRLMVLQESPADASFFGMIAAQCYNMLQDLEEAAITAGVAHYQLRALVAQGFYQIEETRRVRAAKRNVQSMNIQLQLYEVALLAEHDMWAVEALAGVYDAAEGNKANEDVRVAANRLASTALSIHDGLVGMGHVPVTRRLTRQIAQCWRNVGVFLMFAAEAMGEYRPINNADYAQSVGLIRSYTAMALRALRKASETMNSAPDTIPRDHYDICVNLAKALAFEGDATQALGHLEMLRAATPITESWSESLRLNLTRLEVLAWVRSPVNNTAFTGDGPLAAVDAAVTEVMRIVEIHRKEMDGVVHAHKNAHDALSAIILSVDKGARWSRLQADRPNIGLFLRNKQEKIREDWHKAATPRRDE